jgi:hypothetical protein
MPMTDSIEHMMSKMTLEQLNEFSKCAGEPYPHTKEEEEEALRDYNELLKEIMGPQD